MDGTRIAAGVDTHKDKHALCVVDAQGRRMHEAVFPADEAGYSAVAGALGDPAECIAVGIEGAASYGVGLARALKAAGYEVVEVVGPKRRRRPGEAKSDPIDAYRAACVALAGEESFTPKSSDGWVEDVRCLLVAHGAAVKAATAHSNAVDGLLVSAGDGLRKALGRMTLVARMKLLADGGFEGADAPLGQALRALSAMWGAAKDCVAETEGAIESIVSENAPALLAIYGCGPISAASLAVAAGDNPERISSESSFAALCGASPVEASSGKVVRHRLNRGGNRRANCALHRIAICRLQHDERTRVYVDKRMADGKSKKEAIRCLKRYLCREVYRALLHPKEVPALHAHDLRADRTRIGLTQLQVAAMMGVKPARISEIERFPSRHPKLRAEYEDLLSGMAQP